MDTTKPLGGKLNNKTFYLLLVPIVIGFVFIVIRFVNGIGAVTNLSDNTPWGLWISWDVVIGTALACGGYAMALLVYIMNDWKYHHFIRPAITASMLGYAFAGVAIILDVGQYWNLVNFLIPKYWQPNSVLFEIALCVMAYNIVLIIEFLPSLLKRFKSEENAQFWANKAIAVLDKTLVGVIALGIVLPTMHQSSLGSLVILVGHKLNPLWQTQILPLLFLVSCIGMGYGMVIFETFLTSDSFKIKRRIDLLSGLSGIMYWFFVVFIVIRLADILLRGAIVQAFVPGVPMLAFWLEILLVGGALAILRKKENRTSPKKLFLSGLLILVSSALYRYDTYVTGYSSVPGSAYFPSAPEMLITLGIIALEVLIFIVLVKILPVYEKQ